MEVGVPRAEQDHRQRGARAQLGAEMRDTTRLVGAEQDLYGGSLDDHASLSWRAREMGNEFTVDGGG